MTLSHGTTLGAFESLQPPARSAGAFGKKPVVVVMVKPSEGKVARPGGLEPPTAGLEGRSMGIDFIGLTNPQDQPFERSRHAGNTLSTR